MTRRPQRWLLQSLGALLGGAHQDGRQWTVAEWSLSHNDWQPQGDRSRGKGGGRGEGGGWVTTGIF